MLAQELDVTSYTGGFSSSKCFRVPDNCFVIPSGENDLKTFVLCEANFPSMQG